ncbi:hypothetical protein L6452_34135 [Arctium lappa]|uniref:Uncharacterized protein n=1 Tax=Arctium lappa TaxID=4217 RepID=A0ACB8YHH2_ARCLA|nr:hypothetical protein L6452_34135 [Arctium lappa]
MDTDFSDRDTITTDNAYLDVEVFRGISTLNPYITSKMRGTSYTKSDDVIARFRYNEEELERNINLIDELKALYPNDILYVPGQVQRFIESSDLVDIRKSSSTITSNDRDFLYITETRTKKLRQLQSLIDPSSDLSEGEKHSHPSTNTGADEINDDDESYKPSEEVAFENTDSNEMEIIEGEDKKKVDDLKDQQKDDPKLRGRESVTPPNLKRATN